MVSSPSPHTRSCPDRKVMRLRACGGALLNDRTRSSFLLFVLPLSSFRPPLCSLPLSRRPPPPVEVRLSPFSNLLQSTVTSIVRAYILDTFDRLEVGAELEGWREEVQALASDVDRIVVAECGEWGRTSTRRANLEGARRAGESGLS